MTRLNREPGDNKMDSRWAYTPQEALECLLGRWACSAHSGARAQVHGHVVPWCLPLPCGQSTTQPTPGSCPTRFLLRFSGVPWAGDGQGP